MPYATLYPFADLEIDDSFTVDRYVSTHKNMVNLIRYHERRTGKEFLLARDSSDGSLVVTRCEVGTKDKARAARRASVKVRKAPSTKLRDYVAQADALLEARRKT